MGAPAFYPDATLARLLKNRLVEIDAVEPGAGPERKRYAITPAW